MRTYFPRMGDIEPRWFVIDAEGQVLGRLSTTIAQIITDLADEMPLATSAADF